MTPERYQRVIEVFQAALGQSPNTRAAFLAQACAGNDTLLREVEAMLAADAHSRGFLDKPADDLAAAAVTAREARSLIGHRVSHYEVISLLGTGGMGEVYRAKDTRLHREVAIKIADASFSDRFEREARAVAALNHPNICQLYDVGPNYLVMEFVGGETLAARLKRGALKLDQALAWAIQITGALTEAHSKGVVHRDLKPANIMIGKSGAKVLDFGLAKIEHRVTDEEQTDTMTAKGTILGTVQYMSPEQAQGKEADARSDIFSFGLVLYEMITGKRAFEGPNPTSIIAAILEREAPALEPEGLNRVVRACLSKDPADRFQTARDLKRAIEWSVSGDGETSLLEGAPKPGGARRQWLGWSVAAVAAVGLATALWAPWRSQKPVDRPLARLDVDLGENVSLPAPSSRASGVAISPDGTRLAFTSGTPPKLFTRRLDQSKATELSGTEGATGPFFSPDGQWIGFVAERSLSKISAEGGTIVALGVIPFATFHGASWGEDGSIFVSDYRGLLRIPAGGGAPELVAGLGSGEPRPDLPQILSGGKAILFSAHAAPDVDKFNIEVLTLADRHRKIVARGGQSPRYLPTSGRAGYLIYVNKAALFAIPFDLDKLETRGTAVPVLDDVAYEASSGIGQFDFSRTGTLVYRRASSSGAGLMTMQWVDPTGRKEPLRAKPGVYSYLSLSPDGKRVALRITEGGSEDVWVYDPQRDTMTRLTFSGALYDYTRWSPDGQYVVFGVRGKGIFQARADGTGQPQGLTQSKTEQFPWSFTPDGKQLAYDDLGAGNWQIWTVPLEDRGGQLRAGKPEQLKSNVYDLNPSLSPDGRWMAYQSNDSGKNEVYVRAFPPASSGQGGKWQISNGGGGWVFWPRNGHELVYRSGDQIMSVSYMVKGNTFVADKPRVWIAKLGGTMWDLAPDGKSVLVTTPVESAAVPKQEHEVVFLENFFDELRRRVPAGK